MIWILLIELHTVKKGPTLFDKQTFQQLLRSEQHYLQSLQEQNALNEVFGEFFMKVRKTHMKGSRYKLTCYPIITFNTNGELLLNLSDIKKIQTAYAALGSVLGSFLQQHSLPIRNSKLDPHHNNIFLMKKRTR